MRRATELVQIALDPDDPYGAASTPIYQTATFQRESMEEPQAYDYTRSGNPTRTVLERHLARLEGAARAFSFSSGMAALAAVLRLVRPGQRVVAGADLYGGTHRLLTQVAAVAGIEVDFVDATDRRAMEQAVAGARLVLVETPTNPLLQVVDLRELADTTRRAGALLCVDNSLATPVLQLPLSLGADVVVHSATKALSGHADLTAGVVATSDPAVIERLGFHQNAEGTALAPFDAWLLIRGLQTLGVRIEAAQRGASRVARSLREHRDVQQVFWPGLPDHPGRAVHEQQARGPGVVVSFTTGSVDRSVRMVDALRLFHRTVSFGSVHAVATMPCRSSHASIPAAARRLPEDLVRLSIGLEDPEDLWEDLEQAFAIGVRPPQPSARRVRWAAASRRQR